MSTRRQFLRAAGAGAGLLALGACSGAPSAAGPAGRAFALDAAPMQVDLAGRAAKTWGYNGQLPGPEIRLREGETLRVDLQNRLTDPTTVHWHGISLDNAMDGVPFVTQPPVEPGAGFAYEFRVPEPGSFMYHAHVGHQLDQGLYGPLIVEPRREKLSYDREYIVMLDDWRDGLDTRPDVSADEHAGHGSGEEEVDPLEWVSFGGRYYPLMLVNGRPPEDPTVLEIRRGERVRLRVMNIGADTGFRFAVGGHRLTVTHADGMAVQPVTVDALRLGMGERYDVLVDAVNPGAWPVAAVAQGKRGSGRAVLRYVDSPSSAAPPASARPAELDGRLLGYDDLVSTVRPEVPATGIPDRRVGLTLSGTDIVADGLAAEDPLPVSEGEWVRCTIRNISANWHPMHLHGHHFQVVLPGSRGPVKDTVAVPSRGGEVTFDWRADNPGRWLFHCHNHYHMEHGMLRLVEYRA